MAVALGILLGAALVASGRLSGGSKRAGRGALPDTSGTVRMVGFFAGGGRLDGRQLRLAARSDSILIAQPRRMRGYASPLRAANPNVLLVMYQNGMLSTRLTPTGLPESWYQHSASGARVHPARHPANSLMNAASTAAFSAGGTTYHGWAEYVAAACKRASAAIVPPAAGCYLDMLGIAPLNAAYDLHGQVPVDPATGAPYAPQQYERVALGVVRAVRQALPSGSLVLANGYLDGPAFAQSTRLLGGAVDAAQAQAWLQPDARQLTLAGWTLDEDMIASGAPVLARYRCRCNPASLAAERSFAVASFLLANRGHSFFDFQDGAVKPEFELSRLYGVDLGTPLETHPRAAGYLAGGVYQRRYSLGLVLVNPGPEMREVSLGGRYRSLDGRLRTALLMPAHSGVVLVRPGSSKD